MVVADGDNNMADRCDLILCFCDAMVMVMVMVGRWWCWTRLDVGRLEQLELAGGVEDRDLDGANWRAIA